MTNVMYKSERGEIMLRKGKLRRTALTQSLALMLSYCVCAAGQPGVQTPTNHPKGEPSESASVDVEGLMAKAKPDTPESIYFVVQLADAGAVQAVPMLEDKFARMKTELTESKILNGSVAVADFDKANVASALVRLGDTNDIYFEFLLRQAALAANSDIPEYLNYDAEGKAAAGPSRELTAWADVHSVPAPALESEALFELPAAISLLGRTGDPRTIPLLRRALLSPNYEIQIAAARGMAKAQDNGSIPVIVDACRKAPAGAASAIAAASLVYFKSPDAQAAAETFIPKDHLNALRESKRLPGADPFR
jgi:hypothetical protein